VLHLVHESWSHHQVLLQGHCCHLDASMIPHDEAMHKHHCIHALVRGTTPRRYGLCRLALAPLEPARFRWHQLSARRCSCLYITFYARSGLTSMELHVVLTTRALRLSAPQLSLLRMHDAALPHAPPLLPFGTTRFSSNEVRDSVWLGV
jgi:hypothetical protein